MVDENKAPTECSMEGCHYSEDGVCSLHGVEVERRKNIQVLADNIPKLLTTQNWLLGWSVLVMIFIGGSYLYIREVKNDINIRHAYDINSATTNIKDLAKQVESLANGQTRTEERYESLLRAMTDMNANIATLTYLQFEKKTDDKSRNKK